MSNGRNSLGVAESEVLRYVAERQEKKMSMQEAIRDIFICAGHAPLARISAVRSQLGFDGRVAATAVRFAVIPAMPLPEIPPGGVRFPNLQAESMKKLQSVRIGKRLCPSVLVTMKVNLGMNDAALAGLMEAIRRRGTNHQDTARALIAESYQPFPPLISGGSEGRHGR